MKLLSLEPESSASANSAMPAYPLTKHRPVKRWCEERESNPYGVNHTPLKRARLPVPPPSHRTDRRPTVKLTVNRQRIDYTRFHGVCQGVFRKYLRQWAFTFSAVPNSSAIPAISGGACPHVPGVSCPWLNFFASIPPDPRSQSALPTPGKGAFQLSLPGAVAPGTPATAPGAILCTGRFSGISRQDCAAGLARMGIACNFESCYKFPNI